MCLKKYCECFQAGVPCSSTCTCLNCCNANKPGVDGDLVTTSSESSNQIVKDDHHAATSKAQVILKKLPVGTPQPEGEEGIFKAAEDLNLLLQWRKESAKKELELQQSLKKEFKHNSASRPPLPTNGSAKRKRESSIGENNNKSDGYGRLLSFTPIVPHNEGIAGAHQSNRNSTSPSVPVFSLRTASPNSMNIASALNLLSNTNNNSNGKSSPYSSSQLAKHGIKMRTTIGATQDSTTSDEDNTSHLASPNSSNSGDSSLNHLERKDSLSDDSVGSGRSEMSSSNSEVSDSVPSTKRWRGLEVVGVALMEN